MRTIVKKKSCVFLMEKYCGFFPPYGSNKLKTVWFTNRQRKHVWKGRKSNKGFQLNLHTWSSVRIMPGTHVSCPVNNHCLLLVVCCITNHPQTQWLKASIYYSTVSWNPGVAKLDAFESLRRLQSRCQPGLQASQSSTRKQPLPRPWSWLTACWR